ncbi:hypothetical protein ACFLXO_05585 [Chloroflexota bacterium]
MMQVKAGLLVMLKIVGAGIVSIELVPGKAWDNYPFYSIYVIV